MFGKEFENDENAELAKALAETAPRIQARAHTGTGKRSDGSYLEFGVDFSDLSIYEPGSKITVRLTNPSFHLTQPCFRDLKKVSVCYSIIYQCCSYPPHAHYNNTISSLKF